jgi:hypothetical protein
MEAGIDLTSTIVGPAESLGIDTCDNTHVNNTQPVRKILPNAQDFII